MDALQLLGECLDLAVPSLSVFTRPIPPGMGPGEEEKHFGYDYEITGIVLVSLEEEDQVMASVLSAFLRSGHLPDRSNLLIPGPETTFEEISNFILRWGDAKKLGKEGQIFALVADEIPQNLQHETAMALKEAAARRDSATPVVLFTAATRHSTLANHFSNRRTGYKCLSETEIQSSCGQLFRQYLDRLVVHSGASGSGKTFAIRSDSTNSGAQYIHLPINGDTSTMQLISMMPPERAGLLHLDIMDTVPSGFQNLLSQLCLFQSLVDYSTGTVYYLQPKGTSIAVEMAAGTLLERLPLCRLFEQKRAVATAETFCADQVGLRAAMGPEFASPRCDGTRTTSCLHPGCKGESAPTDQDGVDSTTYSRLHCVCRALETQQKHMGFPHDFQMTSDQYLEPGVCFRLLVEAMETPQPSLWCIWSFVNVVYWQLADMHHPESPLKHACMPDPLKSDDVESKAKIKEELVAHCLPTVPLL